MPEPGSCSSHVASHASRSAWPGQLDDLEAQARAPELAAVGLDRPAQLLLDVADHAVVGRRGRAEHRHALGQRGEHVAQAPVVRPEVVPPVGDAVRLVDHDQPDPRGEQRQHVLAEARVVEPLRADQQQVDRVVGQQRADLVPLVAVGRVDRQRADAEPLGRRDLVAHQRQQRRDDQRRPGAALAQQRGGEEVDGRLAPARALHAQHPRAVGHEVAHRLELVLAELGLGPRELAEQLVGAGFECGGLGHLDHVRRSAGLFAPRRRRGPGAARRADGSGREDLRRDLLLAAHHARQGDRAVLRPARRTPARPRRRRPPRAAWWRGRRCR